MSCRGRSGDRFQPPLAGPVCVICPRGARGQARRGGPRWDRPASFAPLSPLYATTSTLREARTPAEPVKVAVYSTRSISQSGPIVTFAPRTTFARVFSR